MIYPKFSGEISTVETEGQTAEGIAVYRFEALVDLLGIVWELLAFLGH